MKSILESFPGFGWYDWVNGMEIGEIVEPNRPLVTIFGGRDPNNTSVYLHYWPLPDGQYFDVERVFIDARGDSKNLRLWLDGTPTVEFHHCDRTYGKRTVRSLLRQEVKGPLGLVVMRRDNEFSGHWLAGMRIPPKTMFSVRLVSPRPVSGLHVYFGMLGKLWRKLT